MPDWLGKRGKVTAEAARRLTGISTPFGGFQLSDPGPSEKEVIRKFIIFLEDRRVLYNAEELEVVSQVAHSAQEIRQECTRTLQALSPSAFAVNPVRSIRSAGRRFHDDQNERFRFFDESFERHRHASIGSPGFFAALGSFRASIGQQVAILAAHYDIDVEGHLASVLPASDQEK